MHAVGKVLLAYATEEEVDLMRRGFRGHILLSHDNCFRSHLKAFGGHGYDYLPVKLVPRLREAGLSAGDIDQIIQHDPQQVLTGS